ncbi:MAG: cbb3-type cytochrome c oxidase subunit I [Hyphomicrobium sp.]|nr:cbb3-type cytochrome c oxidase subunit I [Hyphomicrobium sp.]
MKYQTQKIALAYFVVALALFIVQVSGGLLAGWIYISPNTLSEALPFNIVRMLHTNALIVWLLLGFFGAAYFIIPEESEREIYSPRLAYVQLAILTFLTNQLSTAFSRMSVIAAVWFVPDFCPLTIPRC